MLPLSRLLPGLLSIAIIAQVISCGGPGPCATVDEKVIEGELFSKHNMFWLGKVNSKNEWAATPDGYHVSRWNDDHVLLSTGGDAFDYNYAKIFTSRFGESQWVWLKKHDSCTLAVKPDEVIGGKMYYIESLTRGNPPNPNWHP